MNERRTKEPGCLRELLIVGGLLLLVAGSVAGWYRWGYLGSRNVADLEMVVTLAASPRGDLLLTDFVEGDGSTWYVAPPSLEAAPPVIGPAHWLQRDVRFALADSIHWLPGTSSVLIASALTPAASGPRTGLVRYTLPIGEARETFEGLPINVLRDARSDATKIDVEPLVPNAWRLLYWGGGIERVELGDETTADSISTLTELCSPTETDRTRPHIYPLVTNGVGDSYFAAIEKDRAVTIQRWSPAEGMKAVRPPWLDTDAIGLLDCYQLPGKEVFVAMTTNLETQEGRVRLLDRDLTTRAMIIGQDEKPYIEHVSNDKVFFSCGEGLYRWHYQRTQQSGGMTVMTAGASRDPAQRPQSVTLIAVRSSGWRQSINAPGIAYLDERRAIVGATGGPLEIIPIESP